MSVNLLNLIFSHIIVLFFVKAELFQNLKLKPTKPWTEKFDAYLKQIPSYYYGVNIFKIIRKYFRTDLRYF